MMEEKKLKHLLLVYNKCLNLPEADLLGKYEKAFKKTKIDLRNEGINFIDLTIPERDFEDNKKATEDYEKLRKKTMNYLFFSLFGLQKIKGNTEEEQEENVSKMFLKQCEKAKNMLLHWEPEKEVKKIDLEGASAYLNKIELIKAGSEVSTFSNDYILKEDTKGESLKFIVLDNNGKEKELSPCMIKRVTFEGKPLYKTQDCIAEELYKKRHSVPVETKTETEIA